MAFAFATEHFSGHLGLFKSRAVNNYAHMLVTLGPPKNWMEDIGKVLASLGSDYGLWYGDAETVPLPLLESQADALAVPTDDRLRELAQELEKRNKRR